MQIRIETSRFGTLEVNEDRIIHFPWGIPGFEEINRYILLEYEQGIFHWLQAVDNADVAFIVCMPDVPQVTYTVPPEKLQPIQMQDPEHLAVLNLVSVTRSPQKTIRFHIRSPLLFNMEARLAYQWTMDAPDFQKYVKILEGAVIERDVETQGTAPLDTLSFVVWRIGEKESR